MGTWSIAGNAGVVALFAVKVLVIWFLVFVHTFLADANNGFVGKWVWHGTWLEAGSAVTPSWSGAGIAVVVAGWNPFGVGVLANSDVFAVITVLWLTVTVVDGEGLVFKGGTISATIAGVPSETVAVKTFWVAFLWETLFGGSIVGIISVASLALGLCWTSATIAGFVADEIFAESAGVSLLASTGLARWHGGKVGVSWAGGTVVITIIVAISANVGAFNTFSFTEDEITSA